MANLQTICETVDTNIKQNIAKYYQPKVIVSASDGSYLRNDG